MSLLADVPIPWQALSYLRDGNERQRSALQALQSLGVLDALRDYTPVLVGTLPIAVDVADSDLDIVCEAPDLDTFEWQVTAAFGACAGFRVKRKLVKGVESVIASFVHAGFPIELFGQPRPVTQQDAYRHMVVEARLLESGGEEAREEIRRLKSGGLKTEPAFARYFGLEGDPYEALLRLY